MSTGQSNPPNKQHEQGASSESYNSSYHSQTAAMLAFCIALKFDKRVDSSNIRAHAEFQTGIKNPFSWLGDFVRFYDWSPHDFLKPGLDIINSDVLAIYSY